MLDSLKLLLRKTTPASTFLAWRHQRQKATTFRAAFKRFSELSRNSPHRFTLRWEDIIPCLDDSTSQTPFDAHYIYHTAWAARVVLALRPKRHVDVSSSLYFAAITSASIPIAFYDYRPAFLQLPGLTSSSADLTNLPFASGSIESLSCMHVLEHVGLGRYGDPLDPEGDQKAMDELARVVADGGNLLVVVPVGKPRIQFNAHRIYSVEQITKAFSKLSLAQFSLVTDSGEFLPKASSTSAEKQRYGCGCFHFIK